MKDQDKTKAQLIRELAQLRLQHAELKMFQTGYAGPEKSFYPEDGQTQTILDALTEHVVYHDMEMNVLWANRSAMALTPRLEKERKGRCVGETLGCFHAFDDPNGCGFGPFCKTCKVRLTILETLQPGKPIS